MNRQWLEKAMELRGITVSALRRQFHFSPETLNAWAAGTPARPFSLRKLASILGMEYHVLVRNLGVRVMSAKERRARAPK
jgi:hypothetical protein